jgi:hypothetical protein
VRLANRIADPKARRAEAEEPASSVEPTMEAAGIEPASEVTRSP